MADVNDLKGMALGLACAVIILVFLLSVTGELKTSYLTYTNVEKNNLSLTIYDNVATTFGADDGLNIDQIDSTTFYLYNGTGKALINSANYTLNATGGSIILVVNALNLYNGSPVNASFWYARETYNEAWNASNKGESGLYQMARMTPAIGTVCAAIIIIGMLFLLYRRKGEQ